MNFHFRAALQSYLTGLETFDLDYNRPGIPDIEELGILLKERVSIHSIAQLASIVPDMIDSVPYDFLKVRMRELYSKMTAEQQNVFVSGLTRLCAFHNDCINSPMEIDAAEISVHYKYLANINGLLNYMIETPNEFVHTFSAVDDTGRRVLVDAVLLADKMELQCLN